MICLVLAILGLLMSPRAPLVKEVGKAGSIPLIQVKIENPSVRSHPAVTWTTTVNSVKQINALKKLETKIKITITSVRCSSETENEAGPA